MKATPQDLTDVVLLELPRFSDERGWFQEFWTPDRAEESGIRSGFIQDNIVYSTKGVLRGLHFQHPYAQGKLVTVIDGEIFDVAVDVRPGSSTFGESVSATLQPGLALYIPPGFAHGYQVLSDHAHVFYKCSESYHPEAEHTLLWCDQDLSIPWPLPDPLVSEKDRHGKSLTDIANTLNRPAIRP